MRKIFGIMFVALFLVACTKNNTTTLNDTFINKQHETTLSFEGTLDLSHKQINKMLRDSIIATSFGNDFKKNSNKKVLKKYAKASLKTFIETTDSVLTGMSLYTKIEGKVVYADDHHITFRRIMTTNTAGDGVGLMSTCNYYVFDAKTGCHLQEKDIFSPQQINTMRNLLVERAKELAAQNEIGLNLSRVRPNGNFAIMDSSIIYTFNPYEIARPEIGFLDIVLIDKEKLLYIEP